MALHRANFLVDIFPVPDPSTGKDPDYYLGVGPDGLHFQFSVDQVESPFFRQLFVKVKEVNRITNHV
jgi:hypothetical protein